MRIASLARRSVATLAVAGLLTTAGLTSGLTVGVANAETITAVTNLGNGSSNPATAFNNATANMEIQGSGFHPSNQEDVTVRRQVSVPGQGDITGTVADNSALCAQTLGQVAPNAACTGPLDFSANLVNAAPGSYDVILTYTPFPNGTPTTTTCAGCLTIISAGPATATAITGPGNGQLTITGTGISHGATVAFFNTDAGGAATTPDTALVFTPTSYPSSTSVTGTYVANSGFTPGAHIVTVTNRGDSPNPGTGPLFVQPLVTSNPISLGQGASSAPVTLVGGGFDANTTVVYSDANVTVSGPLQPAGDGLSIVVPTSVAPATTTGTKNLTVKGTGGAFTTRTAYVTVTPSPTITTVNQNPRGQNSSGTVTITGTGFSTSTVFDFGADISAVTLPATTATLAQVTLTVGPDAVVGARNVKATNPADYGTYTKTNGFTVAAKPVITSITPPSGIRNQAVPVTIHGTDFATSGVTITVSGPGVAVGSVVVDSATQIRATFTVASDAPFGSRDVTILNNTNGGSSTCFGCFGVNSLAVLTSPPFAGNNAPKTIEFIGAGLSANTVVTMYLPGSPSYQPTPITGTNLTPTSGGAYQATFDLNNKATGAYTLQTVTDGVTLTCTACFTVQAPVPPAVGSVSPAFGGQGATQRAITITGDHFSPGEIVSFSGSGISSAQATYVSPTQLTALIDIAESAATGARSVTVRNIGDNQAGTTASAFTVNPGPSISGLDTAAVGEGAFHTVVTLVGTGFVQGATADFGPDITVVSTPVVSTGGTACPTAPAQCMAVTINVADPASNLETARDIKVVNPDGGTTVDEGALTIDPAPRITSITPNTAKAGDTKSVTIIGTGFQVDNTDPANPVNPILTIAHVTPTITSVTPTQIVADFAVDANAPVSQPAVFIRNPDDGQSSLPAGFTIATVPVAPTNAAVPSTGNHSATITWSFPTAAGSDGGSPLTGFVVDDSDSSTNNAVTVAADQRTATINGLTNGHVYIFTVKAVNAVGAGPAANASGTPKGVPLPPTVVHAVAGEGQVTVTWAGSDAQGSPITSFIVRVLDANGATVKDTGPSSQPVTIGGLTNGVPYTFKVRAHNAQGDSAFSTASATATPKFATAITSNRTPITPTAGGRTRLYGYLSRVTSGAPIAGATVYVTMYPEVGSFRQVKVGTNSNGYWAYEFAPTYNTTVYVTYLTTAVNARADAKAYKMGVAPRITRTAPADGSSSAASSPVNITGYVTPNKSGRVIGLYTSGGSKVGFATIASNGTFVIPCKLPKGSYLLHMYIGVSPGNVLGVSPSFTIHRV